MHHMRDHHTAFKFEGGDCLCGQSTNSAMHGVAPCEWCDEITVPTYRWWSRMWWRFTCRWFLGPKEK